MDIRCRYFGLPDVKRVPLDRKLHMLFGNKRNGFFIELGANNGISQSNTAFFEFFLGWKGILIEPSKTGYEMCLKNRKHSKIFHHACVSSDFSGSEITGDFDGHLMSSVCGNRRHNKHELTTVSTRTLTQILDSLSETPRTIDLLSLDTEGYELNILKGLDLERYRPGVMLIEIYTWDYDNIVNYLKERGYMLHSNFSNYNKIEHPRWGGDHNDYLFVDTTHADYSKWLESI